MFDGFEFELPLPPFGMHWDVGPEMGQYVAVSSDVGTADAGQQAPGAQAPGAAHARGPPTEDARPGSSSSGQCTGVPQSKAAASVPGPDRPGPPALAGDAAVPGFTPQAFFWALHNHTRMHHDALRSQMDDFEDWLDRMAVFFEPAAGPR